MRTEINDTLNFFNINLLEAEKYKSQTAVRRND